MRREISSSVTMFNQISTLLMVGVVAPIFFLSGLNIFSFGSFIIAAAYVMVGVFVIKHNLSLKKVEMDDTGLFISQINFGKDIKIFVPFEDIERVISTPFWGSNSDNFTIKLKSPTRFGNEIYFSATRRFFKFSEHPIVNELNVIAQNAKFQAQIKMHNP